MGMIRNYCIIREEIARALGLPCYITFSGKEGYRYYMEQTKIIQLSDFVIQCDQAGSSYYIKNRNESHKTAIVDRDELAWIKLSSVELEI
jgi:hypothetical protein